MVIKTRSDSHFTLQVKSLLARIYGRSVAKDSVLERAIAFFEQQSVVRAKQMELEQQRAQLEQQKASIANYPTKINLLDREQRKFGQELDDKNTERYHHLAQICHEIIALCEGGDFNETNRKSSQLLGTIQLLSPIEGKKIANENEQNKPLYKAVLCLRLLDRLCLDNQLCEPHILAQLGGVEPKKYSEWSTTDPEAYQRFVEAVKVPLVMVALLQDIGNFHPDAQDILFGTCGTLDPFHTLDVATRKELLQINYRETMRYLLDGIGSQTYVGNSKSDRDEFDALEQKKRIFVTRLLKNSINPKQGIGNLLKVPQIYTSIVLSTKPSYNYKLIPKVYQVLNQNANRGSCSEIYVDSLYQITGMFPQGFGVTYVPLDADGRPTDRYEYAIVSRLYPADPEHPLCRNATRYLTFISFGQVLEIPKISNLYFAETAKSFATISKERLHEILELLSSNYEERKQLDLLPRCWNAREYFSIKDNQKLWNK